MHRVHRNSAPNGHNKKLVREARAAVLATVVLVPFTATAQAALQTSPENNPSILPGQLIPKPVLEKQAHDLLEAGGATLRNATVWFRLSTNTGGAYPKEKPATGGTKPPSARKNWKRVKYPLAMYDRMTPTGAAIDLSRVPGNDIALGSISRDGKLTVTFNTPQAGDIIVQNPSQVSTEVDTGVGNPLFFYARLGQLGNGLTPNILTGNDSYTALRDQSGKMIQAGSANFTSHGPPSYKTPVLPPQPSPRQDVPILTV